MIERITSFFSYLVDRLFENPAIGRLNRFWLAHPAFRRVAKPVGLLALLAIAIIYPQVFSDANSTSIAFFALLFAAAVTGWNIFSGYTGYISLGHAAFFGLGAYALAIMCQDWNIPAGYLPFLFVPLAGLVAAIFAVPLGWVALRVRRHAFIVITIAIFFIFQLLAYNLTQITNGTIGFQLPIPLTWTGDFYNFPFYYVTLALLVITIAISWFVRNSKYGLGLLAIRDDEDRALGLGVKTKPSKLTAYVISAFIVGMTGAIFAYYSFAIYPPTVFDANFDVSFALMAFMGGLGTISGPILGALLLETTQQYFTQDIQSSYYLVIYGLMFLVVILLLPRGIIPTLYERWARYQAAMLRRQEERESEVIAVTSPIGSGVDGPKKEEEINL